MRTLYVILVSIFLLTSLAKCKHKIGNTTQVRIQGDTLKIITETKGDTVYRQYIRLDDKIEGNYNDTSIYFSKPTDTTIKITDFFFEAQRFKIYFETQQVILFCDSIIKNTPPDQGGSSKNWNIVDGITRLKTFAESGKPKTEELADWKVILLNRFNPLIIDTSTKQKAKKLLIVKNMSDFQSNRNYFAITNNGDTLSVWHDISLGQ